MAVNNNSDTAREIRQALALQSGTETLPVPTPVVNVNPKSFRLTNIMKVVTAAGTIYTAPAATTGKRALYCGSNLCGSKDAADTGTAISIAITPKGQQAGNVHTLTGITLTAQNTSLANNLTYPIELQPGSTVTLALGGTWTQSRAAVYIVEEDIKGD